VLALDLSMKGESPHAFVTQVESYRMTAEHEGFSWLANVFDLYSTLLAGWRSREIANLPYSPIRSWLSMLQ